MDRRRCAPPSWPWRSRVALLVVLVAGRAARRRWRRRWRAELARRARRARPAAGRVGELGASTAPGSSPAPPARVPASPTAGADTGTVPGAASWCPTGRASAPRSASRWCAPAALRARPAPCAVARVAQPDPLRDAPGGPAGPQAAAPQRSRPAPDARRRTGRHGRDRREGAHAGDDARDEAGDTRHEPDALVRRRGGGRGLRDGARPPGGRGVHPRRPRGTGSPASGSARTSSARRCATGMAEKETELRARLGLAPDGPPSCRRAGPAPRAPNHPACREGADD